MQLVTIIWNYCSLLFVDSNIKRSSNSNFSDQWTRRLLLVDRLSSIAGMANSSLVDGGNGELIAHQSALVDCFDGELIARRMALIDDGDGGFELVDGIAKIL